VLFRSPAALELFRRQHRRDLRAALRAVARVRAELGDQAVVRANLQPGHLPEQSYEWLGVERLLSPVAVRREKNGAESTPMVRRLLAHPRPLVEGSPELARVHGEKLLRAAAGPGPFLSRSVRACGPHLVSSGWWAGEKRRAYHFVEAEGGRLLWVYYDEGEQRWYLQGTVE